MQRLGGGSYTRKNRRVPGTRRGGGNNPACGCDMQAGWPSYLTKNIPYPGQAGGSCGLLPQAGGSCGLLPQAGGSCGLLPQTGGQPAAYNSTPVPDACPFPGTGYCNFYARGGANYGEPMNLQAKLRGGGCGCLFKGGYKPTRKDLNALKKWRKGESIGFTMKASLKAKGLIPRNSKKQRGRKVVSAKYK